MIYCVVIVWHYKPSFEGQASLVICLSCHPYSMVSRRNCHVATQSWVPPRITVTGLSTVNVALLDLIGKVFDRVIYCSSK